MSTMAEMTKPRRLRRQFDDEFKAGAVRGGQPIPSTPIRESACRARRNPHGRDDRAYRPPNPHDLAEQDIGQCRGRGVERTGGVGHFVGVVGAENGSGVLPDAGVSQYEHATPTTPVRRWSC